MGRTDTRQIWIAADGLRSDRHYPRRPEPIRPTVLWRTVALDQLREGDLRAVAAIPLRLGPSCSPEAFHVVVLAFRTSHRRPLASMAHEADNQNGSEIVRPSSARFWIAVGR